MSNFLIHYGTPMHSGRYPFGSGERPYQHQSFLFVSGSSKTQDETSPYYRKELPKTIRDEIDQAIKMKKKIIVGDAPGIDRQVQNYLKDRTYDNVEVYGSGKQVRYTANSKWKVNLIDASEYEEGSKEWLAKKDIAMTNAATEGLAVILDEGAKATRKNVQRLVAQNKNVKVYELSITSSELDRWIDDVLNV